MAYAATVKELSSDPVLRFTYQEGPQQALLDTPAHIAITGGAAGGGKGQPLDGIVWTPWGAKPMGELAVGDKVLAGDGSSCEVLRIYPLGKREIYRVTFRDGSFLDTTSDHLWLAWRGHDALPSEARLYRTDQLRRRMRMPLLNAMRFNIPRRAPQAVAPYDLGALLGDGGFTGSMVIFSARAPEILAAFGMGLSGKGPDHTVPGAAAKLRELGLMGCASHEKFVPPGYLIGYADARAELLAGLLDTDGTVTKDGRIRYTSTSEQLASDMQFLVESLGGVATMRDRITHYTYKGERRAGRRSYRLYIKLPDAARFFRVKRKADRCRPFQSLSREVVSVERVRTALAQCISVSHASGLYLAGERPIVTHNTYGLLLDTLAHIENGDAGVVFFRRTYPQITAEGGLWDESKRMYPAVGGVPNKTDLLYEFPSGYTVKFAHLQHEDNVIAWDGAQIPVIMFDQLEHFTERQFWYMTSRNRSATCGFRPYVRATCNPVPPDDHTGGWLHSLLGWWIDDEGFAIAERSGVIRWFVRVNDELVWSATKQELLNEHPDIPPRSFTFIPSKLSDNKILTDNDPAYLGALMALPRYERERLLAGNWKVKADAGLVFDRADFNTLSAVPNDVTRWVRYWDKAGTPEGVVTRGRQKKSAYSAGVLIGERANLDIVVADVVRGRWSYGKREKQILQTAELDRDRYGAVEIYLEQEPGSGGQESAQRSVKMLRGFNVHTETASGSKLERASNYAAQSEAGNVYVLRAEWTEAYLAEHHRFDGTSGIMDQVDASSGGFNKLTLVEEPVQGVVVSAAAERKRQARRAAPAS